MNWNALKNMQCPSCGCALMEVPKRGGYTCMATFNKNTKPCTFFIGKEKFDKTIVSLYKPKRFRTEEDNLSELNNLGRNDGHTVYDPDEPPREW